jgi:WhiB family redox-sensing transcriptional regulator
MLLNMPMDILPEVDDSWRKKAACSGTEPILFHPVEAAKQEEAKALCIGCIVTAECLDFALTRGIEHGIWGGTTEDERRQMSKGLATPNRIVRSKG